MESVNLGTILGIAKGNIDLEGVKAAKNFYAENNFVMLENFIDRALVSHMNALVMGAEPVAFFEANEGIEHIKGHLFSKDKELQLFPNILLNQQKIIDLFTEITSDERLQGVASYVYRSQESDRHALRWHQDLIDQKLFVISANLSLAPYRGGEFALRRKSTGQELIRITNTSPGRLILARIGEDFEHETTKVIGSSPRITLAGWGVGYKWRENSDL